MAEVKFTARDEQFIAACSRMNGAVGRLAATMNVELANSFKQSDYIANNFARGIGRVADSMQSFGQSMSTYVTLPLTAFAAKAVQSFAQMDGLERGLTAVMGSAAASGKELARLQEVAKLPGLGLKEAIQGSTNLQAAGFSAEQARKALLGFGNALATVGKGKAELEGVITALTQIASKGKISAEEINQLAERVPQIRKIMEGAFGTSNTEVLQKMGISSAEFVDKISTELAKLPKVAGGIGNSFENLSDTVFVSLSKIGESINKNFDIEGKVNKLAELIDKVAASFTNLSPEAQTAIISIAGVAAAIGPLAFALGSVARILPTLAVGFNALLGPIGLISTAVILLASNWGTVKTKAFEALYAIGKYAGQTLVDIGNKLGSQTLVNEGMAQLAKSESFRGTYMRQQSTAQVIGDPSAAEDIRNPLPKAKRIAAANTAATQTEINKTQASLDKLNGVLGRQKTNLDKLKEAAEEYSKSLRKVGDLLMGMDGLKPLEKKAAKQFDNTQRMGVVDGKVVNNISDRGSVIDGVAQSNIKMPDMSAQIAKTLKSLTKAFDEPLAQLRQTISESLKQTASDAFAGMGEVVGAMIAGTAGVRDLGRMLGGVIGGVMQQIGRAFIKFGVAKLNIDKLVALPGVGAAAAIAGGALIVGLGSTLKSISQPKAFAKGGIVGSPTNAVFGEYIGAANNQEIVSPLSNLLGIIQKAIQPVMLQNVGMGGGRSSYYSESKLKGSDMYLSQLRETRFNTALRG